MPGTIALASVDSTNEQLLSLKHFDKELRETKDTLVLAHTAPYRERLYCVSSTDGKAYATHFGSYLLDFLKMTEQVSWHDIYDIRILLGLKVVRSKLHR